MEDGIFDNVIRVLSLDVDLSELSLDGSIVQAHQHSAGAKKGPPTEIGHSRVGASTKIHAVVDAYGNPVQLMIGEGQRNDIVYAIPLLEQIKIPEGSQILANRGYDSYQLIDYIYDRGGEPTIPSRKSAKFERHCDWWLYKERHLVEKLFLKLNSYRRIATRYDKATCTYLGILCIATIMIWLK